MRVGVWRASALTRRVQLNLYRGKTMRIAHILLLTGLIFVTGAWLALTERPHEPALRLETDHTMKGPVGLRLISANSEFMRNER